MSDPISKIPSGAWEPCFGATLVPIDTLFTYIREGSTIDKFLADYPAVKRETALWVLTLAAEIANATSITVSQ